MEYIINRRSTRQFILHTATEEEIQQLLLAGMSAPSAVNKYPVSFSVIKDREQLIKMAKIHPFAEFTINAAVAIVVCYEPAKAYPVHDPVVYAIQDASAATMNIFTAAEMIGYGSTWTGISPNAPVVAAFSQELKLPESVIPMAMIVIGKKAQESQKIDKFNPEKVHYGQW
ncbi:Nitroreductase [Hexamita inflata]|uniref:Nitroreductase n=1 Tax=Hexamita inflata TaxID=28002 RepID=A0AA86TI53_9EUKA|nr:Nitroreductase [Hexamita inflata]